MSLHIITGPPCAGKSTWVMERANSDDVVIDLDRIAVAIAGSKADTHGHRGSIRAAAMAARDAVIAEVLDKKLYLDTDVYLIHSMPGRGALGTYAFHDAEVVTIDPGRDVVEARTAAQRPPEAMEVVRKFYERRTTGRSSRAWT